MRKPRKWVAVLFSPLVVVACGGSAAVESPEAAVNAWVTALGSGNESRLAGLHAAETTFHSAAGSDVVGGEAVADLLLTGAGEVTDVVNSFITAARSSVLLEVLLERGEAPDSANLTAYVFHFAGTTIRHIYEYVPYETSGQVMSDDMVALWKEFGETRLSALGDAGVAALRESQRYIQENDRASWVKLFSDDQVIVGAPAAASPNDLAELLFAHPHGVQLAHLAGSGDRAFMQFSLRHDHAAAGAGELRNLLFVFFAPGRVATSTASGLPIRGFTLYHASESAAMDADAIRTALGR